MLSSIPTYYMQLAWLPQSVCNNIDRAARNFIWKGNNLKGVNLVGWNTITKPRANGGLGIRVARDANTAMLGKHVWELHIGTDKLWVQMLSEKYLGSDSILNAVNKYGSRTWNAIIKARDILREGYSFRLGNGSSSFWYAPWSSLGRLSALVPYVDIHDSELSISDLLHDGHWHLEELYTQLPLEVRNHILSSHTCLNVNVFDGHIWSSWRIVCIPLKLGIGGF